jgi:hypothetical protein
MVKLIALVPEIHVTKLRHGTKLDGSTTTDCCKWCYGKDEFTDDLDMEAMIEDCAPCMVERYCSTLDKAASLMGAVFRYLKRRSPTSETCFEKPVLDRSRYGRGYKRSESLCALTHDD